MEYLLALIIIIVSIGAGLVIYLHNQQQNQKVDNYENIPYQQEQQIQETERVDWSITQHIGWLQTGASFENMNLYFNQSDATFFALQLNNNEPIYLGEEIPKDGSSIQLNGKNYTVELEKIE